MNATARHSQARESFQKSRYLSLHPGGMGENSPAFQRWDRGDLIRSPEGTIEIGGAQPSLRDSPHTAASPSVETLGYFRLSLRDRRLDGARDKNSRTPRKWLPGFILFALFTLSLILTIGAADGATNAG